MEMHRNSQHIIKIVHWFRNLIILTQNLFFVLFTESTLSNFDIFIIKTIRIDSVKETNLKLYNN